MLNLIYYLNEFFLNWRIMWVVFNIIFQYKMPRTNLGLVNLVFIPLDSYLL